METGPAASITALDHGQVIQARLARWSVNPRIVVFWFIPRPLRRAPP